jgi:hypothetical protein
VPWVKEIGATSARDGWRDDFPLAHELPDAIEVDCSKLELPIHPMFAVRLRIFIEWHRAAGRDVKTTPPTDSRAKRVFSAMSIDPSLPVAREDDAIMPVTCMREFLEVEKVAERTQEILEYQLHDVSSLGHAAFMTMSELGGNAIDHGENDLGAFAAVRRITEPRRQVTIAIGDLGMGVPEHIRRRYPEWRDDGWAIAYATRENVSGTKNPHRGIGFSSVFEAALTASLHSGQMDILSANGFCRIQTVQQIPKIDVLPATRFRRGTWITYDLVSV